MPGEVLGMIGPSGSGKSTLIRCLNRMETPSDGHCAVSGSRGEARFRKRAVHIGTGELRRQVGMVFQHFNLFPHLTVLENVTVGPIKVLDSQRAEAEAYRQELLGQVGLADKSRCLSFASFRRAKAARGDRPCAGHEARGDAARRGDSALDPELVGEVLAGDPPPCRYGMTMVSGHARNGLCRRCCQPRGVHGRWPNCRGRERRADLAQPDIRAAARLPCRVSTARVRA